MRVMVLNYEFPPVGGGGGRASADLSRALARRGHEIRVLTSSAPGLPGVEERDGYQIRRVLTGRRSLFKASFFSMGAYIVAGILPGLRIMAGWKPDVLHAHFAVPTGILANLLSRITRTPYLLTVHLGDVPGGVPEKTERWFRLIYRWTPRIWREAAAVVAVSEYTRELALLHYPVPIRVIPNGVELPASQDLRGAIGDPPILIFVGRFQPQKNLQLLIRSLTEILDLNWRCVLVGDGPEAEDLDRIILSQGLLGRVERTGWIDGEQAEAKLRSSDILVMPSRNEGLPVIGIQALAYGLAIVATRAGGLTELVQDRVNGRSCEVDDGQCLAESLRWCLQDRTRLLELKRASREMAEAYDLTRVAERYETVMSEAVAS